MTTAYAYSGATYYESQLANEINANTSITTGTLQYINGTGQTGQFGTAALATAISIVFDNALSVGDKTTLDGLVTAHVPIAPTDASLHVVSVSEARLTL